MTIINTSYLDKTSKACTDREWQIAILKCLIKDHPNDTKRKKKWKKDLIILEKEEEDDDDVR